MLYFYAAVVILLSVFPYFYTKIYFKVLLSQATLELYWWTVLQATLKLAFMVRYHAKELEMTWPEPVLNLRAVLSPTTQNCACTFCWKCNAFSSFWECNLPYWWTISTVVTFVVIVHESISFDQLTEIKPSFKIRPWLCWLFCFPCELD